MYTIHNLYDLRHSLAAEYLQKFTYPWEALPGIKEMIRALGQTLGEEYIHCLLVRLVVNNHGRPCLGNRQTHCPP